MSFANLIGEFEAKAESFVDDVKSLLVSPSAQQVETSLGAALDTALTEFVETEIAALGGSTAGLSAATLPMLISVLGQTLMGALIAKLTTKLATQPTPSAPVTQSTPAASTPPAK